MILGGGGGEEQEIILYVRLKYIKI